MQFRLMAVLVGAVVLGGCATVANPARTRSAPAPNGGGNVKVQRLALKNTGPVLEVYEGNTRLEIMDAAGHDAHVEACKVGDLTEHVNRTTDMVTVDTDCMSRMLAPYIELPKEGAHTLRLVRNGQQATVTVKTGTHWQWFWLNGVCLVLTPACWAVDIAAGSWNYYGSLDVAAAMARNPARSAAVSHD